MRKYLLFDTGNSDDIKESKLFAFFSLLPEKEVVKRFKHGNLGNSDANLIGYHWFSQQKKAIDFKLVKELTEELSFFLTEKLNNFFGLNLPEKYWRIRLYPWLGTMVSVIYDRWEILSTSLEKYPDIKIEGYEGNETYIRSYINFVESISYSHLFNAIIFTKIIKHRSPRNIISSKKLIGDYLQIESNQIGGKKTFTNKLISTFKNITLKLISWFFARFQKKISISMFDIDMSTKLQFISQFKGIQVHSTFHKYDSDKTRLSLYTKFKAKVLKEIESSEKDRNIESFLQIQSIELMPLDIFDKSLLPNNLKRKINYKKTIALVASTSLWVSEFVRARLGQATLDNKLIMTSEHGGSIPVYQHQAEFETEFSDIRLVWSQPYQKKHLQVPPLKYLGHNQIRNKSCQNNKKHPRLLFILPSLTEYAYSCDSQGRGPGHIFSLETAYLLQKKLINSGVGEVNSRMGPGDSRLNEIVTNEFMAINSNYRKEEIAIIHEMSQYDLNIIFYPETTVIDALLANKPFLIYYDKNSYLFDKSFIELIESLKMAGIIHTSVEQLYEEIQRIKTIGINKWWTSEKIRNQIDLLETKIMMKKQLNTFSGIDELKKKVLLGIETCKKSTFIS